MRKSTLFVSAVLTTFMLVILLGVVSAYKAVTNTNPADVSAVASEVPVVSAVPISQPFSNTVDAASTVQAASVTPEQAAQLAAQMIGRTDLYSVESSKLNGVDAYLVTFSSGDLVYVSLTGQILSITQVQTYSANAKSSGDNRRKNDSGGSGASSGGGKHEDSGGSEHESDGGGEHEGGGD